MYPKTQSRTSTLPYSQSQKVALKRDSLSPNAKFYLITFAILSVLWRLSIHGPTFSLPGYSTAALRNKLAPLDEAPKFHIVIAHDGEEPRTMITWLSQLRKIPNIAKMGTKTTIYTKSKLREIDKFKNITQCDELFRLRNRGREGGTFLHHIVENYHNLSEYTMFTHEYPVGLNEATGLFDEAHTDALRYQLKNDTGFINHGLNEPEIGWCNCGECEGPEIHQFPLVPQIMALYTDEACHGKQRVAMYNQFLVSRDRILARPKWIYEYLLELVNAPKDHWIHNQHQPWQVLQWMGGSTPDHPLFLYTLERLWSGLFGCDEDPWAKGCVMFLDKDRPAKAGLPPPAVREPTETDQKARKRER